MNFELYNPFEELIFDKHFCFLSGALTAETMSVFPEWGKPHKLVAIGADDRGYCGSKKRTETALSALKNNTILSVNTRVSARSIQWFSVHLSYAKSLGKPYQRRAYLQNIRPAIPACPVQTHCPRSEKGTLRR